MPARALQVICALAAAGLAAWWALAHGGSSSPTVPATRTPLPRTAPVVSGVAAPEGPAPAAGPASATSPAHTTATPVPVLPALPTVVPAGPPKSPAERFATEPRDERWATTTEADLHRKTGALRDVHVEIACKTATCKLTLGGEPTAVGTALDTLGGKQGLHVPITLSAPSVDANGTATVTVYVRLGRDAGSDAPDD